MLKVSRKLIGGAAPLSIATRGTSLILHAAQLKTFLSLKGRMNLKIAVFNLLHSGVLFG
ncbi:MAG: hypothetical protein OXC09_00930 [Truepera sp.]|nr:hypothetical protein [Truepera sp.]